MASLSELEAMISEDIDAQLCSNENFPLRQWRVHDAIEANSDMNGRLIRVNRPAA
jgi:hypothetical protein